MTLEYDVDSSWKHIGYDAPDDYFAETADGSGEFTFKMNIPLAALDAEGDYSVQVDADGNAQVHQTSADHSKWGAYDHWTFDCSATFDSAFETYFSMADIYSDASGGRTVLPKMMLPPYLAMDKWVITGWSEWGDECKAMVQSDQTVLGSLLKTVPSFSLDTLGEQTFDANSAAVCSLIRETILMKWGDTANQPGVQQSCSVDAEWTIKVEWAQQPGS
jgi:hypothetical protein